MVRWQCSVSAVKNNVLCDGGSSVKYKNRSVIIVWCFYFVCSGLTIMTLGYQRMNYATVYVVTVSLFYDDLVMCRRV